MVDSPTGVEHAQDSGMIERIDPGFPAVPKYVIGPDTKPGQNVKKAPVIRKVHSNSLHRPSTRRANVSGYDRQPAFDDARESIACA